MKDANGAPSDADLERLAACLALLASDSGEADNAGRAIGIMARRIGLSGGDLKRIFLTGAARPPAEAERDRLETEASALRHSLNLLDADARRAVFECDVLRAENGRLRASLDRLRARAWASATAGVGVGLLVLVVGMAAWIGQPGPPAFRHAEQEMAGGRRAAIVRPGGALLFPEPERAGMPLLVLTAGQLVQVHRLVWKSLFQWAEVEAPGGLTGYVLTTEIDLS